MNNFFPLIENINRYYPLLDNLNSYYYIFGLFIIYLIYYFVSNSVTILIFICIGILIGFYIVYLMRDSILYFYKKIYQFHNGIEYIDM